MTILDLEQSDSEGSVSSVPHLQARSRVQLHDLENAVRRLAAAYFWSCKSGEPSIYPRLADQRRSQSNRRY